MTALCLTTVRLALARLKGRRSPSSSRCRSLFRQPERRNCSFPTGLTRLPQPWQASRRARSQPPNETLPKNCFFVGRNPWNVHIFVSDYVQSTKEDRYLTFEPSSKEGGSFLPYTDSHNLIRWTLGPSFIHFMDRASGKRAFRCHSWTLGPRDGTSMDRTSSKAAQKTSANRRPAESPFPDRAFPKDTANRKSQSAKIDEIVHETAISTLRAAIWPRSA